MKKSIYQKVRSKLAWKMLFIYIGVVFIPSIIIGVNYFYTVKNYLHYEERDLVQRTLDQYCDDIDADLESVEKVYYQIQQHTNFMRFLIGEYSTQGSQASVYVSEFDTMFSYTFLSSRFIKDVKVYMVEDSLLEMGEYLYKLDKLNDYSLDEKLDAGYWRYDIDEKRVVFRKAIKSVKAKQALGILEVTCTDDIILESLNKLERDERIITLLYKGSYYDINGQDAALQKMVIEVTGEMTRIPIEVRVETMPSSVNKDMTFSLMVSFSCLITLSLILFFVLYRLSGRITKFSKSMANYLTDSPKTYADNGYDELSQLINTYNDMVDNNDYLLNQVKIEKLHQQETEYRALQSQIDPHFIYNSLEGIRMMAEMREDTEVADVIFSLSVLMRYTFSVSDKEVTLARELDYVKQYINIQKMRLGKKVHLQIICDSLVKKLSCPKFVIQPMIENSVKYGFGPDVSVVKICVKAEFVGELIHLRVSNSGQKIQEEKLENMNIQLGMGGSLKDYSSGNGIGLENINRRMRYLHRNSFLMQLSNTEQGVAVDMYWNPEDNEDKQQE